MNMLELFFFLCSLDRSLADGNCLYSAVSLQICGDNSLVKDLRFLTCWEPHHNVRFYVSHRVIDYFFVANITVFKSKSEILSTLLSNKTFDKHDKNYLEICVYLEALY